MKNRKSTVVWCVTVALVLLALCGLVLMPQVAAGAAREGLALCGGVIIPALFPFFVLSSLLVSLGVAGALGRILSPLMQPLFHVSGAGAGALVLGLVGGYPAGARAVRQLYGSGQCSKAEAEHLLMFCNNCGPAFILGAAGSGVFGSAQIGLLLLAGHVLGALTVGVLGRFVISETTALSKQSIPVTSVTLASAFTQSVQSALSATLNVCSYVVLFSVLIGVLDEVGTLDIFQGVPMGEVLLRGMLEMTNGMTALTGSKGQSAVVVVAFLLGFGGLSVQCQTLAMLEGSGLSARTEILGKLAHGVTAALWTALLLKLMPQSVSAMATLPAIAPHQSAWMALAVTGISWAAFFIAAFLQIDSRKGQ